MSLKPLIRQHLIDLDMRFVGFCSFWTVFAVTEWVRASTGDRTVDGSSPTSVKTVCFGTLAIPFTPLCQCLSDEIVKAVGPFYLLSMSGEVKDPTSPHWNV